jgi:Ras-related protein Rab-1A
VDGFFLTVNLSIFGVDFRKKIIPCDERIIDVYISDTGEEERFTRIVFPYYRKAQGIIIVYFVTDCDSFENVRAWIERINAMARLGESWILIGNKSDIPAGEERVVSEEKWQSLAREHGIPFFAALALIAAGTVERILTTSSGICKQPGPTTIRASTACQ